MQILSGSMKCLERQRGIKNRQLRSRGEHAGLFQKAAFPAARASFWFRASTPRINA